MRAIFLSVALVAGSPRAVANDLLELYRSALARDAVLQAATYQCDAAIETRPQALSQLLPQVGAAAGASRA